MSIIVVGTEKGGVGKSTVAFNLAAYLAQRGKVLLVDTDTQRTSVKWDEARQEMGLEKKFDVIGMTVKPANFIVDHASKYDAVVVDVGARDYEALGNFCRIADLVIAPTKVGQGDLESTVDFALAMKGFHGKHKNNKIPMAFVVNAAPGPWNSSEGADAGNVLREAVPTGDVLQTVIRDRRVWRDAHRLGKTIFEMPYGQSEKAIEEFTAAMNEAFAVMQKGATK